MRVAPGYKARMAIVFPRPRSAASVVWGGAVMILGLFLMLAFGPSRPVLMLLSHGAHLLPIVAALLLGVLVWIDGWSRNRIRVGGSVLLWLTAIGWLISYRTPNWPAPDATRRSGMEVVRIVTFNAWFANRDPEGAAQWVLSQQPDAVVLQEVGWRSRILLTKLALELPYVLTCHGSRSCSTVILSRRKPMEMRGLAHGDADNRRALSAAIMRFPGFTLVGLHLSQPWPMGAHKRELLWLATELDDVPRQHLIVVGDFNATGWSITMRDAARMLGLRTLPPDRASWPARSSGWPFPALFDIDHTLLGRDWASAWMERGPDLGSDHYPFVVKLVTR